MFIGYLLFFLPVISGVSFAQGLSSDFFKSDAQALAVLSGVDYAMNEFDEVTSAPVGTPLHGGKVDTFAYKVINALVWAGYDFSNSNYLETYNKFESDNGLKADGLVSRDDLLKLDSLIYPLEEKDKADAPGLSSLLDYSFDTTSPPSLNNSLPRYHYAAQIYRILSSLPKPLQKFDFALLNTENTFIANWLNSASYPSAANGRLFSQTLLSDCTNVGMFVHEFGHNVDYGLLRPTDYEHISPFGDNVQYSGTIFFTDPSVDFYNISWVDSTHFKYNGIVYARNSVDSNPTKYGFVSSYAANYPVEDFAESFSKYVASGSGFRQIAGSDSVLQKKYSWLKENVFGGVEYDAGQAGCTGAFQMLAGTESPAFVVRVDSTTPDGTYGAGDIIAITVTFSEPVTVSGVPQVILETGLVNEAADYVGGSGTAALTFNYVVPAGDSYGDFSYASTSSLYLNGGRIRDAAGNAAILFLPTPGAANSLSANTDIKIDAGGPVFYSVSATPASVPQGGSITFSAIITDLFRISSSASDAPVLCPSEDPACFGKQSLYCVMGNGGSGALYSCTYDTRGLAPGTYSYIISAKDAVGNIGSSSAQSFSVEAVPSSSGGSCSSVGDVNLDGDVTITDALKIAQYSVGLVSLSAEQLANADVNGDSAVNIIDALFIARHVTGLLSVFPACQSVCTGTPVVTAPSSAVEGASFLVSVSGLSGCSGKSVSVREGGCDTASVVGVCMIGSGGCSVSVAAQGAGPHIYRACVDKNNDSLFSAGEISASWSLAVSVSSSGSGNNTQTASAGNSTQSAAVQQCQGQCSISGSCYAGGQDNPSNSCQKCDISAPTTWSNRSCGVPCSGGACIHGSCQSTASVCVDGCTLVAGGSACSSGGTCVCAGTGCTCRAVGADGATTVPIIVPPVLNSLAVSGVVYVDIGKQACLAQTCSKLKPGGTCAVCGENNELYCATFLAEAVEEGQTLNVQYVQDADCAASDYSFGTVSYVLK